MKALVELPKVKTHQMQACIHWEYPSKDTTGFLGNNVNLPNDLKKTRETIYLHTMFYACPSNHGYNFEKHDSQNLPSNNKLLRNVGRSCIEVALSRMGFALLPGYPNLRIQVSKTSCL